MRPRHYTPKIIGGHIALCHICGAYFPAKFHPHPVTIRAPKKTCSQECHSVLTWRTRERDRVRAQVRVCATCGMPFDVPHQALMQERVDGPSSRPPQRFCSVGCYIATLPSKYEDTRHFWREKKRRQRANARARMAASRAVS